MVATQLQARDIYDPRVLEAFQQVPRHEFVSPEQAVESYGDYPLAIGCGQTISQPYIVAVMTQALALTGKETVLEVGTGSGYQTAILACLARHVFSIECFAELSVSAQERLARLGYPNVTCLVGDGSAGYADAAPYEAIVVTAAAPHVPQCLTRQLTDDGRLVIPVGNIYSQELLLVRRRNQELDEVPLSGCRFVPLTGKHGWQGGLN